MQPSRIEQPALPAAPSAMQPSQPDAGARARSVGQPGGIAVRSNLHAGQWQCRSCEGQVQGDQMIRPTCSFCQFV